MGDEPHVEMIAPLRHESHEFRLGVGAEARQLRNSEPASVASTSIIVDEVWNITRPRDVGSPHSASHIVGTTGC